MHSEGQEVMAQLEPRKVQIGLRKNVFSYRVSEALAAQGRVTVPKGIQETWRCGQRSVSTVRMGSRLDMMVLRGLVQPL